MIIPTKIAQFLRKSPRPVKIMADDRTIPVPTGGRVWPSIYNTIVVVKPSKLQAIDAEGNIIRALDLEMEQDDESGDDKSPEMSDLQFFGKLLDGAYDKAGTHHAKIIAEAMKFIEQQSGRLIAADKEIDRLRVENAKLRRELAEIVAGPQEGEAPGGFMGAIISGALASPAGQALVAQAIGAPAPAKTNGTPQRAHKPKD